MKKLLLLLPIAMALFALSTLPSASAITINTFTLDKPSYNPGDTGQASIIFFNDRGTLIRITAVTMSFSYFFQDARVYAQDFVVSGLSMNVSDASLSQPIIVRFSLPSDLAGGYFVPTVRITFNELVNPSTFGGPRAETMDATKPLLVESQYKVLLQSAQTIEYLFIVATVVLMGTTLYFAMRYWSTKGTMTRHDRD